MKKPVNTSIKSPAPIGAVLSDLTEELGIQGKLKQYEAVTRWAEAVGERIAQEAEPQKIEKGVLLVRVRTGVWRNELTMRKAEILAKLNQMIGEAVIKDIKFL
jgi:predicted nucleic acid-binding Zn ribbon protein